MWLHYKKFFRAVASKMSCSLIEAKFQVLDRTIKMLSKSKNLRTPRVASSEQLRELVETQKPTSLLPTIKPVKGVVVARSNQTHSSGKRISRLQPNTSLEEQSEKSRHRPPRPSTGRRNPHESPTEILPDKWIDPKQWRAEQLLQDTWHEIESAVRGAGSSSREPPESKLLQGHLRDERQERESTPCEERVQDQHDNNQVDDIPDEVGAAVHNALPSPKRPLTSAGLQPKKSKAYLSARCRSASSNALDHQPKNWFAPTPVSGNTKPQRVPKAKRKSCRQRPVTSSGKLDEHQHEHTPRAPSPPSSPPRPQEKTHTQQIEANESEKMCAPPLPKADDPSFYMLELRLVHPEPLTDWRFQASFTDTSVNPSKTAILDDLTADDENCLLFDNPQSPQGSTTSRYFNPFLYFPGLSQPSDLYGHVLRIIVTSFRPVTRIVINTSVQFTRFPDEAVVEPPVQSIRQRSETVATQQASLVRVLPRRTTSASSASRRRTKVSKLRKKTPRPPLESNNNVVSTTSLAMDQCNPWTSIQENVLETDAQSSTLEQMFTLQLDEPRSPSPPASPRKGPTVRHLDTSPQQPLATIDKKKMQLQHLRANMRREMNELQD